MLRCLAMLCALTISTGVGAQTSPRSESVEIVKAGLMKAEAEAKLVKDKNISTGQRVDYPEDPKVYDETTYIPVTGKTIFGIEAKLNGRPEGRDVTLNVVWLYPEPGIKNPETGNVKYRDAYDAVQSIGSTSSYYWTLDRGYTHVPGVWTIELWLGDRRLAKQQFTMLK